MFDGFRSRWRNAAVMSGRQARAQLPAPYQVPSRQAIGPMRRKSDCERLTVDQLHRNIRPAIGLADVVDVADVRMGDPPRARRTSARDRRTCRRRGRRQWHQLEGDRLSELQVFGAVDFAHRPAPEQADDAVAGGKDLPGRKVRTVQRAVLSQPIARAKTIAARCTPRRDCRGPCGRRVAVGHRGGHLTEPRPPKRASREMTRQPPPAPPAARPPGADPIVAARLGQKAGALRDWTLERRRGRSVRDRARVRRHPPPSVAIAILRAAEPGHSGSECCPVYSPRPRAPGPRRRMCATRPRLPSRATRTSPWC